MPHSLTDPKLTEYGAGQFPATQWDMVAAAALRSSPESEAALASLCEAYWYPVYAYVRRRGHAADDAQDLTQEFFTSLLEKGALRVADRARGRFRTFLLTALQNFLVKEWTKATAQKRGGGRAPLSLDFAMAEDRYMREPADDWTPERVYERRWALTVLSRAKKRLKQRYVDSGSPQVFERLGVFLTDAPEAPPYEDVAAKVDMTVGAVKMAVHRLRDRYREAIREEIAQMVSDPTEVDDELNALLAALQGDESPRHV